MRTARRPGATRLRTPRWPGAARRLGTALGAGVLVTACAGSGGAGAASNASPSATPPEVLCARIVAHWSREVLDGGTYGDYQSMGLSNGQYDILRSVVDDARAAKKREGAGAADELIDRQSRQGCAARYRSGGPDEGPWQ
ncbi:hypothetical protein P1P75_27655 [Streptomyces sp. ID05-39B]|uniref:hypothetical protein n=1 Tax=Streptomyces sp. ID05-39B TaxID=3028664 RepID=UPI0029A14418|nr:hypothetical protein [Streptomyces sp. ID05-39B]MDX3530083.1 hypothetical protein [Streptomyces sp. ID05-39B]